MEWVAVRGETDRGKVGMRFWGVGLGVRVSEGLGVRVSEGLGVRVSEGLEVRVSERLGAKIRAGVDVSDKG